MTAFAEGVPCWIDVALPDVEAGRRFYGGLFGWTFDEPADKEYGYYTQAYVGEGDDRKNVAALAAKADGRMPTAWGVYFATPDTAALVARAREAGGQIVMDTMPVGPYGTMAQIADPGGAVFGVWQGASHPGFERTAVPGAFCWTEAYVREADLERVDAFYDKVFGFGTQDLAELTDDESGVAFRTWSPAGTEPGDDTAIGGRAVITDALPAEMPAHFLSYFMVEDCDATAAEAKRLGGRVSQPPFDIPYGRMAILVDNQGAVFAVLQEPKG
ncbi:hydrolase [Streptomyces spiroverticillatus]|uniref:Hydrolase n=1 Tax=Streptomyces finlayi TaxID=67296 RepID=A0A918X186_9ACTN|nr:VOC family protein [Streptomyces finlayi]GHA20111.1 hydrolase [Streptomyces spiroverticillatus]GHD02925.1 hydrolase [Streptomyces finlayi]